MNDNDQKFWDEIRALIDSGPENAPESAPAEAPKPQEPPAPAAPVPQKAPLREGPAPEGTPREEPKAPPLRERKHKKKAPPKKQRRTSDRAPGEQPPQDRRRRRRRRRSFPWALSFLTLLVLVGLGYALFQYHAEQTRPELDAAETLPEDTAPKDPGQTFTIAAVGDVTITDELIAAARNEDGTFDFSQTFLHASPILTEADIAVANLDLNFCGEPYGTANRSAPYDLAVALADAGIDLAQMSNSYTILNGIDGLEATLTAVRQAGMEPMGAYVSDSDYQKSQGITLCEMNGFRVAFVTFTKGLDNLSMPEGHDHCVNLLYTDYDSTYQRIDTEGINTVLAAAAAQDPDITIAMVHWGSEYTRDVSSSQEAIRDILLAGGVDVILGSHSHKTGELLVETQGSRSTVTAYSLGNFYGDDSNAGTQGSMILELEFTKDNLTGRAKLTDVSYTPLFIASPSQSVTKSYQVLDLENALVLRDIGYIGSVSRDTYAAMTETLSIIQNSLGDSLAQWKENQK